MPQAIDDLYKLFEVEPACTDEELRKSYRRLLLVCHPDLNPTSIETATNKTRRVLAAYGCLTEWRRAHQVSTAEPNKDRDTEAGEVVIETTIGAVSFSYSFGVSLGRIHELKQELRDAWTEFGARQHDIKAALRFVRAAFQGGRADVAEDLLSNSKLVDAVPILADMYSPDEAARIALIWGQHLYGCQQFDLAIQILQDLLSVAGINSALVAELKDSLRSIHYGIAQSRSGDRKASPATRVVHLNAILELGFEFGYIHKFLAEAFYEMGDEERARVSLRRALEVDPQVSGAKTIMRALGMLNENPRRKSVRATHLYTRPEHVPSIASVVDWFERDQWEKIIAYADASQYSPGLLPSARGALGTIASVLGESNDPRAVSELRKLLNSMYWDVRQNALLALAKIGGESELVEMRKIRQDRGENDRFVVEAVAYFEARLNVHVKDLDNETVVKTAEELLRSYSYKRYGELGQMRRRLEQAIKYSPDARATAVPLLAAYCLQMNDWTRVLKLLDGSSSQLRVGVPRPLGIHIEVASALVRGRMQSAGLGFLQPIYEKLSKADQRRADAVLWDALHSPEFIGTAHYTWALRLVLKSVVSATNPDDLLRGLHRLARIMEPIGQRDMGLWLRHTLREEAPGHYYGDTHDRLNYFRPPISDPNFVNEVRQMCEEYKPQIIVRLRALLGGEARIPGSVSGAISE